MVGLRTPELSETNRKSVLYDFQAHYTFVDFLVISTVVASRVPMLFSLTGTTDLSSQFLH